MLGRLLGFIVCLIGLILPFRLRIFFSEFLGWVIQFFYASYYGLLNYILKELKNAENSSLEKKQEKHGKN